MFDDTIMEESVVIYNKFVEMVQRRHPELANSENVDAVNQKVVVYACLMIADMKATDIVDILDADGRIDSDKVQAVLASETSHPIMTMVCKQIDELMKGR